MNHCGLLFENDEQILLKSSKFFEDSLKIPTTFIQKQSISDIFQLYNSITDSFQTFICTESPKQKNLGNSKWFEMKNKTWITKEIRSFFKRMSSTFCFVCFFLKLRIFNSKISKTLDVFNISLTKITKIYFEKNFRLLILFSKMNKIIKIFKIEKNFQTGFPTMKSKMGQKNFSKKYLSKKFPNFGIFLYFSDF